MHHLHLEGAIMPQRGNALARGRNITPGIDEYTMDSVPPAMPGPDGLYPVPVPGRYDPFEPA